MISAPAAESRRTAVTNNLRDSGPLLPPQDANTTVDAFLSRKAHRDLAPGAVVVAHYKGTSKEQWSLKVPGEDEDVGLGGSFKDARNSLNALHRAKKAKDYYADHEKGKAKG